VRQIRAVEADPTLVDSPIPQAVKLKALDQSGTPEELVEGLLLNAVRELNEKVNRLSARPSGYRMTSVDDLNYVLITDPSELNDYLFRSEMFRQIGPSRRELLRRMLLEKLDAERVLSGGEIRDFLQHGPRSAQKSLAIEDDLGDVPF